MFQPVNVLSRRVTELKQRRLIRTTTTIDQLAVSTLQAAARCSRKNECFAHERLHWSTLSKQLNPQKREQRVCRGNAGRGVQLYVESVESVKHIRYTP